MRNLLGFTLLIVLSLVIRIDAEQEDSTDQKKSNLSAGLKYISNNVYLGRIDSANIMYIVPSIGYYHKSGLHVGASLSYQLDAGTSKIDEVSLEGGYDFNIGERFSGGLSVGKYFYDLYSISLTSVNNFGIGSNFSYDLSVLSLSAGASLSFNDRTDITTSAGLNRCFEIGDLTIDPALRINSGTQNYYNSYLVAGKSHLTGNKGRGKGIGNIKSAGKGKSGTNKATTVTSAATYSVIKASQYKILDYEISIPVSYSVHNFKFDIVPTYSIPVNPASILSSAGTIEKEAIANHFVFQLEIAYKFD